MNDELNEKIEELNEETEKLKKELQQYSNELDKLYSSNPQKMIKTFEEIHNEKRTRTKNNCIRTKKELEQEKK